MFEIHVNGYIIHGSKIEQKFKVDHRFQTQIQLKQMTFLYQYYIINTLRDTQHESYTFVRCVTAILLSLSQQKKMTWRHLPGERDISGLISWTITVFPLPFSPRSDSSF